MFQPGQQTSSVNVETLDDDTHEETETFTLTLSNSSIGRITDATATGSITDDDANEEDTARNNATNLGDITGASSTTYSTLDGEDETRDWFTFTLTAPKRVQLGLRQLDADASITLEDQGRRHAPEQERHRNQLRQVQQDPAGRDLLRAGRRRRGRPERLQAVLEGQLGQPAPGAHSEPRTSSTVQPGGTQAAPQNGGRPTSALVARLRSLAKS